MLFGCYRRGDANDPEVYVAAITAVLSAYDTDLIREVTDPRTGIMTTEKHMTFMPNAGELKVYCEAIAARRERLRRLGDLPTPIPTNMRIEPPAEQPGRLAQVFVPHDNPRYEELVEWSRTAEPKFWKFGKSSDGRDGIWVAHGVWSKDPIFISNIRSAISNVMKDIDPREAAE